MRATLTRSALAALALLLAPLAPPARAGDEAQELAHARHLRDIMEGKARADLLISNIRIVDVYRHQVHPGALLIDGGRIVAVDPVGETARETFDGQGLYATPGLIDGHFHFESQLVTPTALARAMVPHGVTTVFAECLDLVAAAGDDGLNAARILFNRQEELPFRLYPFAPGKKVRLAFTKAMLNWDVVVGLGELNPSHLYAGDEDLDKIAYARALGKPISGHVGDVGADRENLFPALGTMDDHDSWSEADIENNLKIGLPSFLLYGLHGVDTIVPGIVKARLPTDSIMMATDNLSIDHMVKVGDLDAAIRESVAYGLDPMAAIGMSTLNTARHFGMEDRLGSLTPGRFADIVLVDDLRGFRPRFVFKGGVLVAREGVLLQDPAIDYTGLMGGPTGGLAGITADDLAIRPLARAPGGGSARVTVYNFHGYGPQGLSQEVWLPLRRGVVAPPPGGDRLLRFALIERFPKAGRRIIHTGFLRQFALDHGAVAVGFSSPAPWVMLIGTDTRAMLAAMHGIEHDPGGFAVADGDRVLASMPMAIHGMMTDFSPETLMQRSARIDQALAALGHPMAAGGSDTAIGSLLEVFYLSDRHGLLDPPAPNANPAPEPHG
jgi:adenine deaminase